jgi:hypothetical protein
MIPPDEIQEVAVRKLYKLISPSITDYADVEWEDLPIETKQLLWKAATVAGAATPAPIVVSCQHIMPFPHSGMGKHIYADVTKESIDKAVEEFRMFLTNLADDWKRNNEGG